MIINIGSVEISGLMTKSDDPKDMFAPYSYSRTTGVGKFIKRVILIWNLYFETFYLIAESVTSIEIYFCTHQSPQKRKLPNLKKEK